MNAQTGSCSTVKLLGKVFAKYVHSAVAQANRVSNNSKSSPMWFNIGTQF